MHTTRKKKQKQPKISFDWDFCKAHCPKIAKNDLHPRMKKDDRWWIRQVFHEPVGMLRFAVMSNGKRHQACIDCAEITDTQFADYCIEIERTSVVKFLKKHIDMESMAKQCPIYTEMMITLLNK